MLVIFCKAEAIRLSNFNAQKCFCQSATGLMPSDIPHVPAFAQHAHGDNHAHLPCFFPQASVFGIQSFGAAPSQQKCLPVLALVLLAVHQQEFLSPVIEWRSLERFIHLPGVFLR